MGRASRYNINPNLNDIDSTDVNTSSGTDIDNAANSSAQTPILNTDIYYYINAIFESLQNSHIASIKNNISSYKRECKELQTKYENLLAQTSEHKGIISRLEKYALGFLITIIVQLIGAFWAYFGVIYPQITEIKLLKQQIESAKYPIIQTQNQSEIKNNKTVNK